MNEQTSKVSRVATIAAMARRAAGPIGRTTLMKLAYFLQTLRDVPLGYTFRLYTYGPYEPQVLEDLKIAEMMGAVRSTAFSYPGGYGYQITPGDHAEDVIGRNQEELARYDQALTWVVEEFGGRSAIDLEMASTIVYVDRAAAAALDRLSTADIAARVAEIKPRLARTRIEAEAERLKQKGLLAATY